MQAALDRAVAGGRLPGTDQLRSALVAAGFAAGAIEVTQGRTPTGLEADAVEAAVRAGGNCIVAQVRQAALR